MRLAIMNSGDLAIVLRRATLELAWIISCSYACVEELVQRAYDHGDLVQLVPHGVRNSVFSGGLARGRSSYGFLDLVLRDF